LISFILFCCYSLFFITYYLRYLVLSLQLAGYGSISFLLATRMDTRNVSLRPLHLPFLPDSISFIHASHQERRFSTSPPFWLSLPDHLSVGFTGFAESRTLISCPKLVQ